MNLANCILAKLREPSGKYVIDEESLLPVYHVNDPYLLIQAVGYLKYVHSGESDEVIFFRGETKLHGSLVPALLRKLKSSKRSNFAIGKINAYIDKIRNEIPMFKTFSSLLHEPLLQHYGLRTTWIDLVDNIWVALWFACHKCRTLGPGSQYIHFEKRKDSDMPISKGQKLSKAEFKQTNPEFAYILVVGAESSSVDNNAPGYFRGNNTEYVDLRRAIPSIFIRPHAQHGIVFRLKGGSGTRHYDYSSAVRGIIRVRLNDALEWLGSGYLTSTGFLFPSPHFDSGYALLLKANISADEFVGGINHVGV